MFSFLKRILSHRVHIRKSEKTTIPVKSSTVRLLRSEVKKYPVEGTDKFCYSKHDCFIHDQDKAWECINGYHTCAVDSQIDFEQAKSISKSFTLNIHDLNCRENYKSLITMSLRYPLEDANGSLITWQLHDGSIITECLKYRISKRDRSSRYYRDDDEVVRQNL